MNIQIVITQMLMIFIMMAVGYLLMKKGMVDSAGVRQISALVTNVCNPCLLVSSALSKENTASNQDVLLVGVIAFVIFTAMLLFGKVLGILLRVPEDEKNYYCLMTMFGNSGFIGIPLCSAVIGVQSVIYIAVFNVVFNVYAYTYGAYLVTKCIGEKFHFQLRRLVNTGTISSVIAIIIFLLKIPVPEVAAQSITYMGNATIFLAIFVIGTTMVNMPVKEVFCEYRLYLFIVIRSILVPILVAFVMKLVTDDMIIIGTLVLVSGMPVGNLPLMMAKERGLEARIISKGIIVTTLLSIITLPIVVLFV